MLHLCRAVPPPCDQGRLSGQTRQRQSASKARWRGRPTGGWHRGWGARKNHVFISGGGMVERSSWQRRGGHGGAAADLGAGRPVPRLQGDQTPAARHLPRRQRALVRGGGKFAPAFTKSSFEAAQNHSVGEIFTRWRWILLKILMQNIDKKQNCFCTDIEL